MKYTLKSIRLLIVTLIVTGWLPIRANAAIIASFEELDGDIILLATGSVDLTGLSSESTNTGGDFGAWFGGNVAYGSYEGLWDSYEGGTITVAGPWPGSREISGTGDTIGIQDEGLGNRFLALPTGYVSNSDINSAFSGFTISGNDFSSLGLTEGSSATYSWDSGVNGIQSVSIRVGAIPEPSSALLLGLCASGFVATRRR